MCLFLFSSPQRLGYKVSSLPSPIRQRYRLQGFLLIKKKIPNTFAYVLQQFRHVFFWEIEMPFPFRMATVGRHAGSQACEIMTAIVQKHTHIYLLSFAIIGKKLNGILSHLPLLHISKSIQVWFMIPPTLFVP